MHSSQGYLRSTKRANIRMVQSNNSVLSAVGRLLFAVAFLATAASPARSADPESSDDSGKKGVIVIVTKARSACFSSEVRANGTLVARTEAIVIPEAEGFRIDQIMAAEGDRVSSGEGLVRLSRPDGASLVVRSPANGLVIESTAALGAIASARAPKPLFRVAVDSEIELLAEVPSLYVPKLEPGQTARVELQDGRDLPGRVRRVPSEINPVSQLGRVRIAIESDPSLRVGTFARTKIDAARSCGVSIPRSAVYFPTEGASVQIVRGDTVETRRIKVGLMSDDSIEVRQGVAEDEVVIANAGGSLRDGEKVKPVFRDETTDGVGDY